MVENTTLPFNWVGVPMVKNTKKERNKSLLYILPFTIFFILFKLYPIVYGFMISFLNRNSIQNFNSTKFVGLKNYLKVLTSENCIKAFINTLEFSIIYVIITMVLALLFAMLLRKDFKGIKIVRTMYYIPYVTNLIAVGIVWKFLLNPFNGPINTFLLNLGIAEDMLPQWLLGSSSSLITAALVNVWVTLAFSIITLLAAMTNISPEYYECANLEGASKIQTFFHVTIPLIFPSIIFLLMINTINSFKNYTIIVALTNGGPGNSSVVTTFLIYQDAFKYYKFGIASAEAVLLTIFITLIAIILKKLQLIGERKYE